jgi:hypothetical protein
MAKNPLCEKKRGVLLLHFIYTPHIRLSLRLLVLAAIHHGHLESGFLPPQE